MNSKFTLADILGATNDSQQITVKTIVDDETVEVYRGMAGECPMWVFKNDVKVIAGLNDGTMSFKISNPTKTLSTNEVEAFQRCNGLEAVPLYVVQYFCRSMANHAARQGRWLCGFTDYISEYTPNGEIHSSIDGLISSFVLSGRYPEKSTGEIAKIIYDSLDGVNNGTFEARHLPGGFTALFWN